MAEQNNKKVNSLNYGMDLDSLTQYIKEGDLSFALNANIQSNESSDYTYTNEPGNILCSYFKPGYDVIGTHTVIEQGKTVYFLVNTTTGDSEIGYILNKKTSPDTQLFKEDINKTTDCVDCQGVINSNNPILHLSSKENCVYNTVINCKCLNFDINYPVKIVHKVLACGTIFYFVDGKNPDRSINLEDPPYKKEFLTDCLTIDTNIIDCNLMNFYPDILIPCIDVVSVVETGSLEWGTYQFVIAYANEIGESQSKFFSITNPTPIIDLGKLELNFGQASNKAIKLNLSNLDTTSFSYYNLYVLKTVRNVTSVELVETLPTTNSTYVYTGDNKTQISIPVQEVFADFPFYISNIITTSNGYLMKGDLKSPSYYNWQKAFNNVQLKWVSYVQEYRTTSYKNPTLTTHKRTYQRDEVYPFGIVAILKNGEQTSVYPLIGRSKTQSDIEVISNNDSLNFDVSCSDTTPIPQPKWKVYNTAHVTKTISYEDKSLCDPTPFQEGEFAYTESTERYPCLPEIWGDLANTPIRHFKFPENSISHIHDSNDGTTGANNDIYHQTNKIFPIGVKLDFLSLNKALLSLTDDERNNIQYIKVVRGNRVNNKSVIAKGLVYNVGEYDEYDYDNKKTISRYYANYPFNDLRKDPYLCKDGSVYNSNVIGDMGDMASSRLDGFGVIANQGMRYTFHSPDTHFFNPGLGNILKLETEEYGVSLSMFKEVEGHAKYKFLTIASVVLAGWITALTAVIWGAATGVSGVGINGNIIPLILSTYTQVYNIIKLATPYRNFCYQQNSVGNYNNYKSLFNNGDRQRKLDVAAYLTSSGYQSVGDDWTVNQYHRESSVYLKVANRQLPVPTVEDTSRFTMSSSGFSKTDLKKEIYQQISSYYASVKRDVPDQYGPINNIEWLDTGVCIPIVNGMASYIPDIFGGDTYITKFALKRKLRYFNDDRVGFPNDADIDYEFSRNISNPIYYFNTSTPALSDPATGSNNDNVLDKVKAFGGNIVDLFKSVFGISKHNLDEKTGILASKGYTYLFNYGIPYFFVESDVNTEYRFAEDEKSKDFYPRMVPELDIPNQWLQEKNVPIYHDNSYIYNKDYSKQNKENSFAILPADYTSQICRYTYPNRVIYSEPSLNDEQSDKWLLFMANSFYDFPREYGALKILKGIENTKVLCIFENTFSVYNAYNTIKTSTKDALVGNGGMFTTPPLEYNKSEVGYGGTNNNIVYTSNHGTFWIDSERTKIYNLSGQGFTEISDSKYKLERFFNDNLGFKIREYFPDVYTDNPYKGIGFSMGWDEKNSRLFVTKLDYEPISSEVAYDSTNKVFYNKFSKKVLKFSDSKYFCDKSFTIALKSDVQRWVSFYSFKPNYYISHPTYFQTGVLGGGVWSHELSNKIYQTYYNKVYPYVLEYVVNNGMQTDYLQSLAYSQEIKEYYGDNEYYTIPDGAVNFTKAIIYNTTQSTGLLNLVPKPKGNLSQFMSYPKFLPDSKDILYTYYENKFSFNTFWDISLNQKNRQPIFMDSCSSLYEKSLNPLFHDYHQKVHAKNRIRGEFCKVRLIQDAYNRYKFINFFNITNNQNSF